MANTHRFRDEIVLGDLAFEATADSVSELFAAAALAVIEAMADPLSVKTKWTQEFRLSEIELGDLLFEWLNTIVFIKDTHGVVFHDIRATVSHDSEKNLWHLDAALIGDAVDATRQDLRTDVKAVTKHLYEVGQKEGTWYAHVVLDV
ncbi:MAG: archease [Nitrospira sp.]|nr:archease [Nitrospira sp.]